MAQLSGNRGTKFYAHPSKQTMGGNKHRSGIMASKKKWLHLNESNMKTLIFWMIHLVVLNLFLTKEQK